MKWRIWSIVSGLVILGAVVGACAPAVPAPTPAATPAPKAIVAIPIPAAPAPTPTPVVAAPTPTLAPARPTPRPLLAEKPRYGGILKSSNSLDPPHLEFTQTKSMTTLQPLNSIYGMVVQNDPWTPPG